MATAAENRRKRAISCDWLRSIASAETVTPPIREAMPNRPHGSERSAAKLTEADVVRIRQMEGTAKSIAEQFGVSRTCIVHVQIGKTWAHVGGHRTLSRRIGVNNPRAVLTAERVREIRDSPLSYKKAAKHFGVSKGHVWSIRKGLIWKHLD